MITCSLCKKRFANIGGLSKHRSRNHPNAVAKARTKKSTGTKRSGSGAFCPHCGGGL